MILSAEELTTLYSGLGTCIHICSVDQSVKDSQLQAYSDLLMCVNLNLSTILQVEEAMKAFIPTVDDVLKDFYTNEFLPVLQRVKNLAEEALTSDLFSGTLEE